MEGRAYMFSTANKRSTLLDNKFIYFPREEEGTPRFKILKKECPEQFTKFQACLEKGEDCAQLKSELNECGTDAFKKANTTKGYQF